MVRRCSYRKDWPHIWLSEGIATYLTSMYFEHKYGAETFLERMINERETVVSYNLYKPGAVVDYGIIDLNQLLNPNTYQKAAWILHMLRKRPGTGISIEFSGLFTENLEIVMLKVQISSGS